MSSRQDIHMGDTDSVKNQPTTDQNSASSSNQLLSNDDYKKPTSEQSVKRRQTLIEEMKKDPRIIKRTSILPPLQSPVVKPSSDGLLGNTTASTIIWYICICVLFIVAFLALVLSVLYFITDTTSEQVIKLYGIAGAATLAIVTFIIVCIDCCNDGSIKDHEETVYRVLQVREANEKAIDMRRNHRVAEGKEVKPNKPFILQHQQPLVHTHPHSYIHHHPHYHSHHTHVHPSTSFHQPFVCPVCHELHASGNDRHKHTDIAVDTSDKFEPVSKKKKATHKSTRDVQTEPKFWDAERGTQTDRAAGTQTSAMELSGLPSNVTEIIHETTILKAPRSLLPTLKKSMQQQDNDIAANQAETETNTTTAAVV